MGYSFNTFFDCFISIGICFLLSVTYVASLYMWRSQYDRNHPITIKQRFLSVFIMMFVAPIFLYVGLDKSTLQRTTFLEVMGFRTRGLIQAYLMPLMLTMILFSGSLYMQLLNGNLKHFLEPMYWVVNIKEMVWLRNHIVAPLSEEFTFRACMLPLLLQCFSPMVAVFVNPLFFGIAHFHHMIERLRYGMKFKAAFLVSCFHFTYTTIFGAYSAYIFLRTGHLLSSFVVHAFCNHMGVPDIQELLSYKGSQWIVTIVLFIVGCIGWCYLLNPLTEPRWYYNENSLYGNL